MCIDPSIHAFFAGTMQSSVEEAKIACGLCVTTQLKTQNSIVADDFVGFTEGIHGVLQHKDYLISNCKFFERSCRKGVRNCGHFAIPLLLYYVSQEVDFYLWFDVQIMFKLSNATTNRVIMDACSFVLLNDLKK